MTEYNVHKIGCIECDWTGWTRRDLPVSHPEFGKGVPCDCNLRAVEAAAKKEIPQEMEGWSLANFPGDARALEQAYRAYNSRRGIWVFWSETFGTGKTGILVALVNECKKAGRGALYRGVPAMLDKLRNGYEDGTYQELMDYMMEIPILALDEFHRYYRKNPNGSFADGSPDWASEKLFQIVDSRYMNYEQRLTLVATNRNIDKGDDDPIASRFHDSKRSHIIRVGGADMRPRAEELEREFA